MIDLKPYARQLRVGLAMLCLATGTLHAQQNWQRDHNAGAKAAKAANSAEAERLLLNLGMYGARLGKEKVSRQSITSLRSSSYPQKEFPHKTPIKTSTSR